MQRAHYPYIYIILTVCTLLCVRALYCQETQDRSVNAQEIDVAKESLDRLIEPYKERDKERFMDQLSREFRPGYAAIENTVSENFKDYSDIDVSYDIVNEYGHGDYVILEIRWRKIWASKVNKSYKKETGNTTFTFLKHGNDYKLIDMSGDDLF